MTDPTEPVAEVRLAKPGEIRGYTVPGGLLPEYVRAADLASKHPEHPVIVQVFSYSLADQGVMADPAALTARKEVVRREAASVSKAQLAKINEKDRIDTSATDDAPERFHVGHAIDEDELTYKTFVVFHPDGRPRRTRRSTAEADPAPTPDTPPDTPLSDELPAADPATDGDLDALAEVPPRPISDSPQA